MQCRFLTPSRLPRSTRSSPPRQMTGATAPPAPPTSPRLQHIPSRDIGPVTWTAGSQAETSGPIVIAAVRSRWGRCRWGRPGACKHADSAVRISVPGMIAQEMGQRRPGMEGEGQEKQLVHIARSVKNREQQDACLAPSAPPPPSVPCPVSYG